MSKQYLEHSANDEGDAIASFYAVVETFAAFRPEACVGCLLLDEPDATNERASIYLDGMGPADGRFLATMARLGYPASISVAVDGSFRVDFYLKEAAQ